MEEGLLSSAYSVVPEEADFIVSICFRQHPGVTAGIHCGSQGLCGKGVGGKSGAK